MVFNSRQGLFVPTTYMFDVSTLEGKDLSSPEFKEFIIRLTQRINELALNLNRKDTGIYSTEEYVNSQVYFPDQTLSSITTKAPVLRTVFRKVIDFGGLPNTGTTSVAHNIILDANSIFTRIYATATDPNTSYIPIPYSSSTLANNIEINVDTTNVNITTGSDRTGFTTCFVVIEYIR